MKRVFLETPWFTWLLGDCSTDERYRELQRALMENPETGDVMPGTGGFRKVRFFYRAPPAIAAQSPRLPVAADYYDLEALLEESASIA